MSKSGIHDEYGLIKFSALNEKSYFYFIILIIILVTSIYVLDNPQLFFWSLDLVSNKNFWETSFYFLTVLATIATFFSKIFPRITIKLLSAYGIGLLNKGQFNKKYCWLLVVRAQSSTDIFIDKINVKFYYNQDDQFEMKPWALRWQDIEILVDDITKKSQRPFEPMLQFSEVGKDSKIYYLPLISTETINATNIRKPFYWTLSIDYYTKPFFFMPQLKINKTFTKLGFSDDETDGYFDDSLFS